MQKFVVLLNQTENILEAFLINVSSTIYDPLPLFW